VENNYSIDEILLAVDEIQKSKKIKKIEVVEREFIKRDNSEIPKGTLSLIEEAEKIKN
jgi:hypothetical protein